jgi:polar amino acid transport system substrate-binding protein
MAMLLDFRRYLCAAIVAFSALGGRSASAEPLRLVTFYLPPYMDLNNDKAPGLSVEVVRQVLAGMGQEASFEELPLVRGWAMIPTGERDGIFGVMRTGERTQICHFPDEPLKQEQWVFFVRTADAEKLKFSSFDELVGHDIAVAGMLTGAFLSPSYVTPGLWKLFSEHHNNLIETTGSAMPLRMLAAGRVDYAIVNLSVGTRDLAEMGLSGSIEPLESKVVMEGGYRVCFSKARVEPAFVGTFSNALKQFKQTEAYRAIYRKYFP